MTHALPPPRLLVLIGGVSGVGKSYTAQALARPLSASLRSTDVLRAAMRHLIHAQLTPHLHRSGFTIRTNTGGELLTSIDHQTAALVPTLQAVMERAMSEHPPVVDGVYLFPNLPAHLLKTHMPRALLTAPTFPVYVQRLQQRSRRTCGQRPARPPTQHLTELRAMAPVLIACAQNSNGKGVPPWDEHPHAALPMLSLKSLTGTTSPPAKVLSGARGEGCL
jgi:2-phosphoglycerate kinase